MKVEYNIRTNTYTVTINKLDLDKAFENPSELQLLLHNIVVEAYGIGLADELFPITKEK